MAFKLGYTPEKFEVVLRAGSDFVAALRRSDQTPWPTGAQLDIEIDGTTLWPATLAGDTATWEVDQVDVDAVIATRPRAAKLWYTEGPTRLLWAAGSVKL